MRLVVSDAWCLCVWIILVVSEYYQLIDETVLSCVLVTARWLVVVMLSYRNRSNSFRRSFTARKPVKFICLLEVVAIGWIEIETHTDKTHSKYNGTTVMKSDSWAPCGLRELWFFVRIGPIHFLAGCRKKRLNQGYFGFVRFSFWGFLCISLGFLYLHWML